MKKILIAAPVHQTEEIFEYYLQGLDWLVLPQGYEVDKLFVLHNSENLIKLCEKHRAMYGILNDKKSYKVDEETHHWDNQVIDTIANIKNSLMRFALDNGYDYIFFVDSDLVLHPVTLSKLIEAKKEIVAEIFWTQWTPDDVPAPNAWDFDNYVFRSPDRWKEWKKPGLYDVGMSGACILISRDVIKSGVNYSKLYNLNLWGEDRHFCIRAASHGFQVWLDTYYPAIHLYRQSEVEKYKNGELKHG